MRRPGSGANPVRLSVWLVFPVLLFLIGAGSTAFSVTLFFRVQRRHIAHDASQAARFALLAVGERIKQRLSAIQEWQESKFHLLASLPPESDHLFVSAFRTEVGRIAPNTNELYCSCHLQGSPANITKLQCAKAINSEHKLGNGSFVARLLENQSFNQYELDSYLGIIPQSATPYDWGEEDPFPRLFTPPDLQAEQRGTWWAAPKATVDADTGEVRLLTFFTARREIAKIMWTFVTWMDIGTFSSILSREGERSMVFIVGKDGRFWISSAGLGKVPMQNCEDSDEPLVAAACKQLGNSLYASELDGDFREWNVGHVKVGSRSSSLAVRAVDIGGFSGFPTARLVSVHAGGVFFTAEAIGYLVLICSVLVLFTLLSVIIGVFLTRPLRRMVNTMLNIVQRIRAGEPDACSTASIADSRINELHQIASSFDHMLRAINANNSELRKAKMAAEASARAQAHFLASISHEIRTPLNGIVGSTHLLFDGGFCLPQEQKEILTEIASSAEHLNVLLGNVLDMAKLEAHDITLECTSMSLHREARAVTSMLSRVASAKGVSFSLEIAPNVPTHVLGDAPRLRQVMTNLVSNAIKFTNEGGAVTMALRLAEDDSELPIFSATPVGSENPEIVRLVIPSEYNNTEDTCNQGGEFSSCATQPPQSIRVRLVVRDSGIGMDHEMLERLCGTFQQATPIIGRGGSGLGLAITKALLELMHAEMNVASAPEWGTEFSVLLDFKLPSSLNLKKSPSGPLYFSGGRFCHILVVEDNPVNQRVIVRMLGRMGLTCELSGNGQEGFEMYKSSHKRFEAVLMDLQMPVCDGCESARQIRRFEREARIPHKPIIALTAAALEESRATAQEAGMDGFLTKPVVPGQLLAMLLQHCPALHADSGDPVAENRDRTAPPPRSTGASAPLEASRRFGETQTCRSSQCTLVGPANVLLPPRHRSSP
eukprot:TRINITY_DN4385_c0_g2_i1.p1 TRINITY_DN4385_c0_g2~~TRINITY_DN4385_c0_g2_i1.p1  ORF type:complete len:941 (+),score=146.24 TRINITY_DN4385_c0_g2_i1:50-2872(+)